MIRLLVAGVVGAASVLAGGQLGAMLTSKGKPQAGMQETKFEFLKLEPTSVPVIRNGRVEGYTIARVHISALAHEVKVKRQELQIFAAESAFRAIFEEENVDFKNLKPQNIVAISERIVKFANARLGRVAFRTSSVESINFVEVAEVRCQKLLK